MKADSLSISRVFSSGGDVLYLLPYFQREYSWDKGNWETLLNDLYEVHEEYSDVNPPEHFMGALVVVSEGNRSGTISAFTLVDGQQRLTTISLVLCALRDIAQQTDPALARKIGRLLVNQEETGDTRFKLLPTEKYGDREAFISLILAQTPSTELDSRIPDAYSFIRSELERKLWSGKLECNRLFNVLSTCLHVVFITLDRQERPYEIFESLNAKGKPLSQADLVRNYIAMKLPEIRQADVFRKVWSPIEAKLQEKRLVGASGLGELTAFIRHYLAYHSGMLCNAGHVYARFRDRIEAECPETDAFIAELENMKRFADYYDHLLRPETERDPKIKEALNRLNIFEVATIFPFLLGVYDAYHANLITREQVLESLAAVENYVVRRFLAGDPTNFLNKLFPGLWKEVAIGNFTNSVRHVLASRSYPSNNRVRQGMLTRSFYDRSSKTQKKVCVILESINRNLSKGTGGYAILDDAATIEHILPQSINEVWKEELGSDWEQIHSDSINLLGNLTIVTREWNSSLSNAPFNIKKERLVQHALKLNTDYFTASRERWNEHAIQERSEYLAGKALEVWPTLVESLPEGQSDTNLAPTRVEILGKMFEVNSWRDVAEVFVQTIVDYVDDFDKIRNGINGYFYKEEPRRGRQLSNGWWLNVNLSGASIRNLCRNLAAIAELEESDWAILYD